MADQKGIGKLDEKLINDQIIPESFSAELPLVHKKMNAILKKTGAILSDEIFETGNAALRKWLNLLHKQGASQEKLTAYLRSGLAHLTYDFIESQYHQIDIDDLVSRTLVSLKNRNLHASFFKAPAPKKASTVKKAKPATKKIKAIKKVDLEKKAKPAAKAKAKPAAKTKAKPAAKVKAKLAVKTKKTVGKKATVKKATVKKTVAKKTAAKKPTAKPKKTATKKTIAKKKTTAPKKAAPKKTAPKKVSPKKVAKKKVAPKKTTAKKIAAKKK